MTSTTVIKCSVTTEELSVTYSNPKAPGITRKQAIYGNQTELAGCVHHSHICLDDIKKGIENSTLNPQTLSKIYNQSLKDLAWFHQVLNGTLKPRNPFNKKEREILHQAVVEDQAIVNVIGKALDTMQKKKG